MFKQGKFAKYNGREYELGRKGRGWINLISSERASVAEGFLPHKYDPDKYIKRVERSEIHESYIVRAIVVYEGNEFTVRKGSNDMLLIGTSNSRIGEMLHLDRLTKFNYEKWIHIKEASQITEIKIPITL